jgi:Isochorismatase family
VSELSANFPADTKEVDKTAFSMLVPELTSRLIAQSQRTLAGPGTAPISVVSVILVGIETHICITQTALDLLSLGHKVYVLADGVSSCNAGERGIALARLAQEGCVVTTSESVLFELVGDAAAKDFKAIAKLVKDTKDSTKEAVEVFCGGARSGGGAEGGFKL